MEIFFIVVVIWIGLALLFAYLAQELGLTYWIFLVLGLLGSPALSLFALAMFNVVSVTQGNGRA